MTKKLAEKKVSMDNMVLVTGGSVGQTADDSLFLSDMGLAPDRFGRFKTNFHWRSISEMVDGAWAKGGICCCTNYSADNTYKIIATGQTVTRAQAMTYVANKLGKKVNINQYIQTYRVVNPGEDEE